MPKDILERNIKRASEKGQEAYIEKIYEVGGTLIIRQIPFGENYMVFFLCCIKKTQIRAEFFIFTQF